MQGKTIRLKRLLKHSDRMLIVPMDHGVSAGPIAGLEDIRQAVISVADGGADAVIVHKGLVRQIGDLVHPSGCELIVHLSASTSLAPESNRKEIVSSVQHAIRLGATAVSVHVNLADPYEAQMIKDLGYVAEECDLWEMPLLAMMYVRDGSKESEYDPAKIKHAARVAEEVGADLVKVNYTGTPDSFIEVTASVKIPVLIAGGPRMDSQESLLIMVAEAMEAGARGVSIGRNVFQSIDPRATTSLIRYIMDHPVSSDAVGDLLKREVLIGATTYEKWVSP